MSIGDNFLHHAADCTHHLGDILWLDEDGKVGGAGDDDLLALRGKLEQVLLPSLVLGVQLVDGHAAEFPFTADAVSGGDHDQGRIPQRARHFRLRPKIEAVLGKLSQHAFLDVWAGWQRL